MEGGPSLEISLPSGWGEDELAALLAPVRDVRIAMLTPVKALIHFSSHEAAREAVRLMDMNITQNNQVQTSTCLASVSTALLVSHRYTWRVVESLHSNLLELFKAGPLQKADLLLQRLQVASLARQLEERTQESERLQRELSDKTRDLSSSNSKKAITMDIQEQLQEAANRIQATQKQLNEARDRARQADVARDVAIKDKAAAETELQAAEARHALTLHARQHDDELYSCCEEAAEDRLDCIIDGFEERMFMQHHFAQRVFGLSAGNIRQNESTTTLMQQHIDHLVKELDETKTQVEEADMLAESNKRLAARVAELERGADSERGHYRELLEKAESKVNLLKEEVMKAQEGAVTQSLQERDTMEDRIAALAQQVEAAARQRNDEKASFAGDVKRLEAEVREKHNRAMDTEAECRRLQQTVTDLQQRLGHSQDQVASRAAEASMWKNEAMLRGDTANDLSDMEDRLRAANEKESQLKRELSQGKAELSKMQSAVQTAQQQAEAKQDLADTLSGQLKEASHSLKTLTKKAAEGEWAEENYSLLASELETTRAQLKSCRKQLHNMTEENRDLHIVLEERDEAHAMAVRSIDEDFNQQKAKLQKVTEEASRLRTQLQQAGASLHSAMEAQTSEASKRNESAKHQQSEFTKLRNREQELEVALASANADVRRLSKALETEEKKTSDLQTLMAATRENKQVAVEEAASNLANYNRLQEEVEGIKRKREQDAKATHIAHKQLAAENTELTRERDAQAGRLKVLAEALEVSHAKEAELGAENDDLHSQLDEERAARVESESESAAARSELAKARAICKAQETKIGALHEELSMRIPEPAEPQECVQCEVYQAARRLQQEVMTGMQQDVAAANADAEAMRLRLSDSEATVSRMQGELLSLRALLSESEAHASKLESRPSETDYTRTVERLQAAESALARMENESHAAIGEASEVARAAEERASQVKRLEEFIKMLEEKHRSAEASLRSTVSDQSVALEQTKAAVYTASHPSWGVDTRFTLHRDGSFSRSGEKEGFWSLEVSGDGAYGDSAPAPVGGVTLRLIWVKGYQGGRVPARHSHDAEIDQLLSDDKGGTWVARSGFKLKIVEQRALFGPDRQPMAPDWLLAMVFQKKLEDAEARAASATWKWQASASASPRRQSTPILPHQAAQSNPSASPRGTFNGYSSPPRISNNPRPPVTPLGGDSFHPTSLKRTPAHPPQDPAHSPAHPFNSRTSIAHSPSPHFQHPSQPQSARQYHQPPSPLQAHAPPPASDAKQYEQIFSIQYPGVDASLLHGVSLNVAEGMMTETQARLMLTDMATVDAFEDM